MTETYDPFADVSIDDEPRPRPPTAQPAPQAAWPQQAQAQAPRQQTRSQQAVPPPPPPPRAPTQTQMPAVFPTAPTMSGFNSVPPTHPGVRPVANPTPAPQPAVAAPPFGRPTSHPTTRQATPTDVRLQLLQRGREALEGVLATSASHGATDVHLVPGSPPRLRMQGQLVPLNADVLTPEQTHAMAAFLLTLRPDLKVVDGDALDIAIGYTVPGAGRFRVSILRQRGTHALIARVVRAEVPTLDQLTLPPQVKELAALDRGLVVIAGASNTGRTTTMAALLEEMNTLRAINIVTIEQPVEYALRSRKASILQRDVGADTADVAQGIHHALRQDADVIAIDGLHGHEAIDAAIHAAEAGRLVIGVVTASDPARVIQRILSTVPADAQASVRARLSDVLHVVIVQRLVPSTQPQGRMAACEVLRVTSKIGETIRDGGRMNNLARLLRESEQEGSGSLSLEASLNALVRARMVDAQRAAAITGPASPVMTTEM